MCTPHVGILAVDMAELGISQVYGVAFIVLLLKLGTHHAIFVGTTIVIGTTIVVRRDDGRRSSNDPLTPRDGRRLTAHTTQRPSVAHTTADSS